LATLPLDALSSSKSRVCLQNIVGRDISMLGRSEAAEGKSDHPCRSQFLGLAISLKGSQPLLIHLRSHLGSFRFNPRRKPSTKPVSGLVRHGSLRQWAQATAQLLLFARYKKLYAHSFALNRMRQNSKTDHIT
jgi:hypothetical protein